MARDFRDDAARRLAAARSARDTRRDPPLARLPAPRTREFERGITLRREARSGGPPRFCALESNGLWGRGGRRAGAAIVSSVCAFAAAAAAATAPGTAPKMPSPREPGGSQGLGRRQSFRLSLACQVRQSEGRATF